LDGWKIGSLARS